MVRLIGELIYKQAKIKPNGSSDVALEIKNPSDNVKLQIDAEGQFQTDINLNSFALKNVEYLKFNNTNAPGTPAKGMFYYDDTANKLKYYTTSWQTISTAEGDITGVTAGDGLSGGGSSGDVTLDVDAGNGLTFDKAAALCIDTSVVVDLNTGQTLTNKTLTTPTIGGTDWANANHSHAGSTSGGQIAFSDTTGTVGATRGGTGQTAYVIGDILYASTTTALSKLPISTDGKVLTLVSGVPAWADASGDITGVTAGDGLTGGGTSGTVTLDVGAGAGIGVNANDVYVSLATNSGLNTTSGLAVDSSIAGNGISFTTGVLAVELSTTSGLSLVGTSPAKTLEIDDGVAGDGLTITSKVLALDLTSNGGLLLTGSSPSKTIGVSFGTGTYNVAAGDHTHSTYLLKAGDTMTGNLAMGTNKVICSAGSFNATDLVNKTYVDNLISGLSWKQPAAVQDFYGNDTVANLNGLTPTAGDAWLVTDVGTLTRGSVSVSTGDVVQDDGTNWVKVITNSGGYVPIGTRIILSSDTIYAPYTNATDNGKVLVFSGASNTGTNTGDAVNNASLLISDPNEVGYYNNNSFVFDGTVPTGTWRLFSGAGQINAGIGLAKTGNTLNVNLGDGIVELPSDQIGIDLLTNGGLALTGTSPNKQLGLATGVAGDGLTLTSGVLAVGAGTGISVASDSVAINQAANLTWTGTHNFTSTFQISSVTLTASATEINDALDGISANVTDTNLNTLTAGSSTSADALHTHSGLAKQYTDGGFSAQTSVTVAHNKGRYPLVQVLDSSGFWIIPGNLQHTSVNSFTVTFAESTTGTIVYIA